METSDTSLLRRFQRGDGDAATALYLRYAQRLTTLAHNRTGQDLQGRYDAEDVVQSVFRTFFRRVSQGSYDVPHGEELWGLLLTVTLNKVRGLAARHRALKRNVTSTVTTSTEGFPELSEQGDEASLRLLKLTIAEFSERLDDDQRRILELRVEGYEIAEIAERCGRTKRTVERVLQNVRTSLKKLIDE